MHPMANQMAEFAKVRRTRAMVVLVMPPVYTILWSLQAQSTHMGAILLSDALSTCPGKLMVSIAEQLKDILNCSTIQWFVESNPGVPGFDSENF